MSVSVIVGGQYGSEGKGKIAAVLADSVDHSVRTGGPNAGHTVVEKDEGEVFRHVPVRRGKISAAKLYLGAGAIIGRRPPFERNRNVPTHTRQAVLSIRSGVGHQFRTM